MQTVEASAESWQAQADRAERLSQRHQDALAQQTGDNLVLVLKLRQAEDAARAAAGQRDALQLEVQRQQGPWLDQVQWPGSAAEQDHMPDALLDCGAMLICPGMELHSER